MYYKKKVYGIFMVDFAGGKLSRKQKLKKSLTTILLNYCLSISIVWNSWPIRAFCSEFYGQVREPSLQILHYNNLKEDETYLNSPCRILKMVPSKCFYFKMLLDVSKRFFKMIFRTSNSIQFYKMWFNQMQFIRKLCTYYKQLFFQQISWRNM